jgi:hypothetical protein
MLTFAQRVLIAGHIISYSVRIFLTPCVNIACIYRVRFHGTLQYNRVIQAT